jgi:hypothetical protein
MRIGDTSTTTKPGSVLTEKGKDFAPAIAKNDRIELSFLAHALSNDDARISRLHLQYESNSYHIAAAEISMKIVDYYLETP